MYNCPSDWGVDQTVGQYQRRRGNYMINWGNATYGGILNETLLLGNAPFSNINGKRETPRVAKFSSITDGLSNTLMMSEYLKAQSPDDNDWRGDIHNDEGVFRFHTIESPNSTVADVIASGWYQNTGDPLMPAAAGAFERQKNAARSRHTGGVNALHCDASVAFYSEGMAPNAWKALGTMDGAETEPAN